jgi:hypothetical protein
MEPKLRRGELLSNLAPLMVDKTMAAQLCSMSVATYEKYAKRKFLPPMNVTGRISVDALRQAVCRLDGFMHDSPEDPDAALAKWEAENAS